MERPIKCREYACVARPDCTGGYNPDVEVTSVLGRLRVRQVRRIHTLARGLGKCRGTGLPAQPAVLRQLRREWAAICAAKGYAPSFPVWTLRVACFTSYPDDLPSTAWLEDLLQYVRYDCDAVVRQQAQQRAAAFRYNVHLDQKHGSSRQGFQALRPEENPPFREVPYTCSVQVQALGPAANGQRSYSIPASTVLRAPAAAQLDLETCQVVSVQEHEVCLQGTCLPNEGRLQQTFVACTAPELHRAFADFWGPIWQRDGPDPRLDLHDWPDLERILEAFRCDPRLKSALLHPNCGAKPSSVCPGARPQVCVVGPRPILNSSPTRH